MICLRAYPMILQSRLLSQIDELLRLHVMTAVDITSADREVRHPDYPLAALQQLVRNGIMHRLYEGTNAPLRIYWYADRIEIISPGGPFGQVTPENFGQPGVNDYRNRHLAEAMRCLGYAQHFGVGIQIAREALPATATRRWNSASTPARSSPRSAALQGPVIASPYSP